MTEIFDCIVCTIADSPEEINGVRTLKTFKGYTVDLRLKQLRKVPMNALPEFIDFDSLEGLELVAEMHNEAIGRANEMVRKARSHNTR